jgi:uncharacterized membrane protein YdbT with pleckstrin-like domain
MSSYVEGALVRGERLIHVGRLSLWALAGPLALGVVLLPVFGAGLIVLGMVYIKYKSTELAITNRRVIAKFGFISRRTIELNLAKVESIQVDQSLMGRVFDYGTLVMSGAGAAQAPIAGIADPLAFRRAFIEAHDAPPSPLDV